MKSKKIICLVLVILMMILTFNINSYAVTLPELMITSYNYAVGDKMRYDDVKDVEVEQTLQLYAVIAHGNEMLIDNDYDSLGWFVDEANLSGTTWTSSNNSIATVDNNGKVTGVAKGKATITAKYNNETANYEVNVIERTSFYVTMRVKTEGGSITSEQGLVAGATSVEKGKNLKIYICPDEGYEIDKVLVDNQAIDLKTLVYEKNNPNAASEDGVAVYTFANVSKDHIIEAYYKKKSNTEKTSFYVTMRVKTEGGSITSEQGLVAGATSVEKGKNLKIYICPDEGYEIDKVLVDNQAIDLKTLVYEKNNPNAASEDGVAVYTFTNVSKDYTIEVYYKKKSNSDPTKSPVNPGTSEKDSPTTKSDQTTSPTILPKTGENQIIFVLLISSIAIVTYTYMGYKKYKKIG